MTIKAFNVGSLALSEIRTEFGGPTPISLGSYRSGGAYVSAGTLGYPRPSGAAIAIPSSGAISVNAFYGSSDFTVTSITFAGTSFPGNGMIENSNMSVFVSTLGIPDGTTMYWTISHGTTSAADFNTDSGTFVVNSNFGSFPLFANPDGTNEPDETFTVQIRSVSTAGPILGTSPGAFVRDNVLTMFVNQPGDGFMPVNNLRQIALNAGWNGTIALNFTLTITAGIIYGQNTSTPAITTGSTAFPVGSTITLVNNGVLAGHGGAGGSGSSGVAPVIASATGLNGGPSLDVQIPLRVQNNGIIGGGGGGGGGGGVAQGPDTPNNVVAVSGGGGGGGGRINGGGAIGGSASSAVSGDTLNAGSAGGNASLFAPAGGGAGGFGGDDAAGGAGGAGGDLGQVGAAGASGGGSQFNTAGANGGSPGAAVQGYSNVTWVALGTILGPILG